LIDIHGFLLLAVDDVVYKKKRIMKARFFVNKKIFSPDKKFS